MIFAILGKITIKDDDKIAPCDEGWVSIPLHRRFMKKTVLIFGLISGVLSSAMMLATVPFIRGGHTGYTLGYTAIVLSFLLVYFGIRSYRDNVGNGQITFGKGFTIGILITLISCVFYVVTWEIVYFNFLHGMMDPYFAHQIDQAKASGASAAAIQARIADINQSKQHYENPFINAAYTFIEPFPVGLLITLASAGVLRKKAPAQTTSALPTSA
jgi:Protein of unknown function (DUF4199)